MGKIELRWRFAGFVDSHKFPSFEHCYRKRLQTFLPSLKLTRGNQSSCCNKCCDFYCITDSKASHDPLSNKYPTTTHKDAPLPHPKRSHEVESIQFIEQDYPTLINCVNFLAYNIATGIWNAVVSRAYFSTLGLKVEVFFDRIWKDAKSLKSRNALNVILSNQFNAIPKLWRSGYHLHQFLDSPMHH